jgi:UDP-N-acetylglucosamine 4,6-dehydratase
MKLITLVEAIAPGCRVDVTGMRPGEKLHESLISEDDAHNVLEYEDFYLVKPAYHSWTLEEWTGGKAVPDRFNYRSDTNPWQLTKQELVKLAEAL